MGERTEKKAARICRRRIAPRAGRICLWQIARAHEGLRESPGGFVVGVVFEGELDIESGVVLSAGFEGGLGFLHEFFGE